MFRLTINTDNAAFEDDAAGEVARILRTVAYALEFGDDDFSSYRTLYDSNGNDVGRARLRVSGERDD